MQTLKLIKKLISRNYAVKIGANKTETPVKLIQQGGKWFFDVKKEEKPTPKSISAILRVSSVLLGLIGVFLVFDVVSQQSVDSDGKTFEETNALKLKRAWNAMLKNVGTTVVAQIEEAEKKKEEAIKQRIIEEAESQNYKVVQIRDIKK